MSAFEVPVAIGLGSNVGDSLALLRSAVRLLGDALAIESVSGVYRTSPMYVADQPDFLNAALTARTDLGPRSLLALLKGVEVEIGRQSRERYGPREIDLDLIAYGSLFYRFSGAEKPLFLPHPKTAERRFVLEPLTEIAPSLMLVGLGTASELLKRTGDRRDEVELIRDAKL